MKEVLTMTKALTVGDETSPDPLGSTRARAPRTIPAAGGMMMGSSVASHSILHPLDYARVIAFKARLLYETLQQPYK